MEPQPGQSAGCKGRRHCRARSLFESDVFILCRLLRLLRSDQMLLIRLWRWISWRQAFSE